MGNLVSACQMLIPPSQAKKSVVLSRWPENFLVGKKEFVAMYKIYVFIQR